MKKKFLGIIAVFLLSVFIIPSKVFAADGKVFTINVPSNASSFYYATKDMTMREYTILEYLDSYDAIPIEPIGAGDVQTGYEYKEGMSKDSLIDITEEMRENFVEYLGEDILEGYDKISINLYEQKEEPNDGKLVIDFTEVRDKDYWDLPTLTVEFPRLLYYLVNFGDSDDSDIINTNFKMGIRLTNKNGKTLLSETMSKDETQPKSELAKDITEADDIVYNITEEDIAELGIENFNYNTFVVKFSDKKYDSEKTYVYDIKAMVESQQNSSETDEVIGEVGETTDEDKILNYFMKLMYENKLLNIKSTVKNAAGKDLIYYDISPYGNFGAGMFIDFELASDVTSKDNIVLNITDEDFLSEILKMEYDLDITKLFINFPEYKTYKVLEGAKQKFDVSSKKQLVFRVDVDYNVFKESGKVYMDGKLVDPKNYTTKSGSTIITFNTNYTNTLSQGTHTLKVTTNQGETTTTFTVTDSVNNPNTGDNILMYVGLLTISVGSIIASIVLKKKVN